MARFPITSLSRAATCHRQRRDRSSRSSVPRCTKQQLLIKRCSASTSTSSSRAITTTTTLRNRGQHPLRHIHGTPSTTTFIAMTDTQLMRKRLSPQGSRTQPHHDALRSRSIDQVTMSRDNSSSSFFQDQAITPRLILRRSSRLPHFFHRSHRMHCRGTVSPRLHQLEPDSRGSFASSVPCTWGQRQRGTTDRARRLRFPPNIQHLKRSICHQLPVTVTWHRQQCQSTSPALLDMYLTPTGLSRIALLIHSRFMILAAMMQL